MTPQFDPWGKRGGGGGGGGGGGQGVNLTSYLDSAHMVSQYLLIHSKAVNARIKAKTPNRLFYDPSLTHRGGKSDRLSRLFTYSFPIHLNTL